MPQEVGSNSRTVPRSLAYVAAAVREAWCFWSRFCPRRLPTSGLRALLLSLALLPSTYATQSVSLGWKASADPRTTGYTLVYGPASGVYDQSANVGNVTEAEVAGLAAGQTYYFAVFAYGNGSLQSDLSNEVSYHVPLASTVVSRLIFYNNSAWDGYEPGPGIKDDAAIATDKTALRPGEIAAFSNYTSYSRGINGILIDILSLGGTPTVNDFIFKAGNDNSPSTWAAAPAPSSISVRAGAGAGGSDRVTLIWPDGAISKKWLQVTVLATVNTRLANPDVFYFGNAIGDYGNSTLNATVTSSDALQVLSNVNPLLGPITIPGDFNRDRKVTSADALIALNNVSVGPTALKLINLTGAGMQHLEPHASFDGTAYVPDVPGAGASSGSVTLLGRAQGLEEDFIRVWFVRHSAAPVQIWRSASMAPADWMEVSASSISDLGDGIIEVRVPTHEADSQAFFRFESDDTATAVR